MESGKGYLIMGYLGDEDARDWFLGVLWVLKFRVMNEAFIFFSIFLSLKTLLFLSLECM